MLQIHKNQFNNKLIINNVMVNSNLKITTIYSVNKMIFQFDYNLWF